MNKRMLLVRVTEEKILTQNYKSKVTWSFKISNEQLRYITDTLPMRDFCYYLQHLKYGGHVCRPDNSQLQKQVVFYLRTPRKIWTWIERLLDMDVQQARRKAMKRTQFLQLLDPRFKQGCSKATTAASGKI